MSVVRCLEASRGRTATESQEKNAQRYVENLFQAEGLSLPIPIEEIDHEVVKGLHRTMRTYHVTPESWVKCLLSEEPLFVAGATGELQQNCRAFWEWYRLQHTSHAVYAKHGSSLQDVLPLYLHGDEGRGKRKTGYMVLSFESPFGPTPRKNSCECEEYMRGHPELPVYGMCREDLLDPSIVDLCSKMFTNYRGHSY